MPALPKLALCIAVVLLAAGLAIRTVQFLLAVGLLVLVAAGIMYLLRRARSAL